MPNLLATEEFLDVQKKRTGCYFAFSVTLKIQAFGRHRRV